MYICIVAICGILIFSSLSSNVNAQNTGINWYELCKNPVVDILITEPCSDLTTNGGYTLTPEGERVLTCLSGGAVAILAAQPELLALKNKVGCGTDSNSNNGYSSTFSNNQGSNRESDPIGDLLGNLFG